MANKTTMPIKDKLLLQEFLSNILALDNTTRGKQLQTIALFELNTALRISDVLKLNVHHVLSAPGELFRHIVVKEKKTGKENIIYINEALQTTLLDYIDEYGLTAADCLFPGRYVAAPLTYRYVQKALKRVADALGIENFGTHSLRKTWGYHAYLNNPNAVLEIMKALNHSNIQDTLRYIGIDQDSIDKLRGNIQFAA